MTMLHICGDSEMDGLEQFVYKTRVLTERKKNSYIYILLRICLVYRTFVVNILRVLLYKNHSNCNLILDPPALILSVPARFAYCRRTMPMFLRKDLYTG